MGKYDDIINLPHHESPTRTRMSMENRAAQFAPFAALSGHEDAINETARLTEEKIEPTDEEKQAIWRVLEKARFTGKPVVITYFIKDRSKYGGSYHTVSASIKKFNEFDRIIELTSGALIPIDDIISAKI